MGNNNSTGFDIGSFGQGIATEAVGGILGMATAGWNDKRQLKQQEKLQELQMKGQKQMTDYNTEANLRAQMAMWEKTGYGSQKEQMIKAGLNPALMYGMSGGGGTTVGGGASTGNVSGATAPSGGGEIGMGIQAGLQAALMQAQIKNIEADTADKTADAIKKGGVDTKEGESRIANNVLDGVIKEYTGKTGKLDYELREGNQEGLIVATNNEIGARQSIADIINQLWASGKLKEKSLNEIEGIALQNANTREQKKLITKQIDNLEANTKGKNLENIITELETKLQTQTGIDRNAPTWLKIIGRLFVELMGN